MRITFAYILSLENKIHRIAAWVENKSLFLMKFCSRETNRMQNVLSYMLESSFEGTFKYLKVLGTTYMGFRIMFIQEI